MHMAKAAAILGSSGGNLYNLGGKDPESLLGEMVRQIKAAGIQLAAIQFIAAEASMDTAKPETKAALWTWDGEQPRVIFRGTLEEVNREAVLEDEKIAGLIDAGKVDGLILASCDPKGANARAMAAAAEKKLAATGTGGTSMALAKFWNLSYRPAMNGGVTTEGPGERTSLLARISVRGILMASLPGFIAMALTLILSKVPGLDYFEKIFNVMIDALPVIVATVAAKQVSGMGDVAIVAGVVTGILSVKGGLIGGIIGGIIAGILVQSLLLKCLKLNFPATTANIVAGGIAGLAAGLLIYLFIAPLAEAVGNGIRYVIDWAFSIHPVLCGGLAGLLIWPAIMGGMYHAAILPIILLEMEKTGNSFLGAIDMVGLVMVSAGIMAANILAPRRKDDRALAIPGLFINMAFGTFVEAAYPFMFSNKVVMAGAIIAAGVGGVAVGYFNVRGTAYVPSIVAPTLSNNVLGFALCMFLSAFCAFCITVAANRFTKGKEE